jgi:hypothetical protein
MHQFGFFGYLFPDTLGVTPDNVGMGIIFPFNWGVLYTLARFPKDRCNDRSNPAATAPVWETGKVSWGVHNSAQSAEKALEPFSLQKAPGLILPSGFR